MLYDWSYELNINTSNRQVSGSFAYHDFKITKQIVIYDWQEEIHNARNYRSRDFHFRETPRALFYPALYTWNFIP